MKVLVIGFDGASPPLIEKWIEKLPTVRTLKKKGQLGLTVPPIPAQKRKKIRRRNNFVLRYSNKKR